MINPWLETIGVIILASAGIFVGRVFSHLRKSWWMTGYFLSLVLIAMLAITRINYSLGFMPPFLWFTTGRIKFVLLSLAATIGLTTPLSRLPYKFEKVAICIMMTVVVWWFSILPFLYPALIKNHLSNLHTVVNSDGLCFQTKDYTCAPAAAVTALRKLGLPANEGEMAVLAHTSPITGTMPWCLYTAIQNRYGHDGLKCQYRHFDSITQLQNESVTLAAVRDTFLSDHCVAVLEVSDKMVTFADPVWGRRSMSLEQFEKIWRFSGIVLRREATNNI